MHKSLESLSTEPEPDDLVSEVRALRRKAGDLRVLVFGSDAWLTWSVARCLIRARYQPVVLGPPPVPHLAECTALPASAAFSVEVLEDVEVACLAHDIDVVLPADLPAIQLAARFGSRVRSAGFSATPVVDTLVRCCDPWQFARTLAALEIPHPQSELARDAQALRDTRLTFPVTTRSIAWTGHGRTRQHNHLADLTLAVLEGELDAKFPLLIQEVAPGTPVSFAFLARHGRLMAHTAFEPRRPNAWRFFEAPELRDQAARAIEATAYHGVGRIEARYDAERHVYRMLSLHPGFWDSHLCAEHAGMNFPDLLARMPDLGPGAGFMASPRPVGLSYFERGVAGVIRLTALTETLRSRVLRPFVR